MAEARTSGGGGGSGVKLPGGPLVRWGIGIVILVAIFESPSLQAVIERWLLHAELAIVGISAALGLLGVAYGVAHFFHHSLHEQGKKQIVGSVVAAIGLGTIAQWFPLAMALGTFLIGAAAELIASLGHSPGAGH
jgi:hypothetical protein